MFGNLNSHVRIAAVSFIVVLLSLVLTSCTKREGTRNAAGTTLVPVQLAGEAQRWSLIDALGNTLVDRKYVDAHGFSEGLAAVTEGNGWGYVDVNGNLVIPYQFDYCGSFSEGLAPVFKGKGTQIEPKYTAAQS